MYHITDPALFLLIVLLLINYIEVRSRIEENQKLSIVVASYRNSALVYFILLNIFLFLHLNCPKYGWPVLGSFYFGYKFYRNTIFFRL